MVPVQKVVATGIVLISSLLVAAILKDYAFSGILCILGLLGLQPRFTREIPPERRALRSLLLLLVLVIFALHYRFGDLTGVGHFNPTAEMAWQTITRFFLASMVLILFLRSPEHLLATVALFHLGIAVSAGQVLLLDGREGAYRLLELMAVALATLYIATAQTLSPSSTSPPPRHPRREVWAFAGLIVLTLNIGWIFSSLLYQNQRKINLLSHALWGQEGTLNANAASSAIVGFDDSGRLENLLEIMQDLDQDPVLSIAGKENPGYVRARAFDKYRRGAWVAYPDRETLYPERQGFLANIPLPGRKSIFQLAKHPSAPLQDLEFTHRSNMPGIVYAPFGSVYIEVTSPFLVRDENAVIYAPKNRIITSYKIAYDPSPPSTAPNRRLRSLLNLPPSLDPGIPALADRLCGQATTDHDRINAVIQYFNENYTYTLGIDTPPGQDPVTHFLLNGSSGYCEYFATGAALLLRTAGVPTRYVTGFRITESGGRPGTWVARNANAHAWVEAWDKDNRQWRIVEATVQESLIETDDVAASGDGLGILRFLRPLTRVFYEYGFAGALIWIVGQLGGFFWVGLAFVLLQGVQMWRRHRIRANRRGAPKDAVWVGHLHQLLRTADRRLRRLGFRRLPGETLLGFAHRLETAGHAQPQRTAPYANWYRHYAGLRYGVHRNTSDVDELGRALKTCSRKA